MTLARLAPALCAALFVASVARAYYGGMKKAETAKANPSGPNPFIDPEGFRRAVDGHERRFREQLASERLPKYGYADIF
jgi:hypothetical protein